MHRAAAHDVPGLVDGQRGACSRMGGGQQRAKGDFRQGAGGRGAGGLASTARSGAAGRRALCTVAL
eukprot:6274304-Pyramimonas_sp.AAC.1